jgi:hypothetical protein
MQFLDQLPLDITCPCAVIGDRIDPQSRQ